MQTLTIRLGPPRIPDFAVSIDCDNKHSFTNNQNSYVMQNLKNNVQLIGRLGIDPEVKTFGENKRMVRLSLATNDKYRNSRGETVEDTQWHSIVAWGKTAEIAEKYLKKGQEVAVRGKLNTRQYDDANGNRRYLTEVVCNELMMLGSKSESA